MYSDAYSTSVFETTATTGYSTTFAGGTYYWKAYSVQGSCEASEDGGSYSLAAPGDAQNLATDIQACSTSVDFSWDAPASGTVDHYKLEFTTDGSWTDKAGLTVNPASSVQTVDLGTKATYQWRVVVYGDAAETCANVMSPETLILAGSDDPGDVVVTWGKHGTTSTQDFNFITGIAYNSRIDKVYVQNKDSLEGIRRYDSDGNYEGYLNWSGYFDAPLALEYSNEGGNDYLYLTNAQVTGGYGGGKPSVMKVQDTGGTGWVPISKLWETGDYFDLGSYCVCPPYPGQCKSPWNNYAYGAWGVAVKNSIVYILNAQGYRVYNSSISCSSGSVSKLTVHTYNPDGSKYGAGIYQPQATADRYDIAAGHGVAVSNNYIFTGEYIDDHKIWRMPIGGGPDSGVVVHSGEFIQPAEMTVGPDGRLYVCWYSSTTEGFLTIHDSSGTMLKKITSISAGCTTNPNIDPYDVAIDSSGYMYITDRGPSSNYRDRVIKLNPWP